MCFSVLQLLFIMSAVNYSALTYERPGGVYEYPGWAVGLGWGLAGISIALVPIMTLINTYRFVRSGKVCTSCHVISFDQS